MGRKWEKGWNKSVLMSIILVVVAIVPWLLDKTPWGIGVLLVTLGIGIYLWKSQKEGKNGNEVV